MISYYLPGCAQPLSYGVAKGEASDKADQEDLSADCQKIYLEKISVTSQKIMNPVQDTRRFVEKEAKTKTNLCFVSCIPFVNSLTDRLQLRPENNRDDPSRG